MPVSQLIPLTAMLLLSVGGVGLLTRLKHRRRVDGRHLLARWAARHGHHVTRVRVRRLFRGPFCHRATSRQVVYRVTIRDGTARRRAYVRAGHPHLGPQVAQIAVRWDDTPGVKHMRV
jgi:hypothetical protein